MVSLLGIELACESGVLLYKKGMASYSLQLGWDFRCEYLRLDWVELDCIFGHCGAGYICIKAGLHPRIDYTSAHFSGVLA